MADTDQIPSIDGAPVQSTVQRKPEPRIIANDVYTEALLEQVLYQLKLMNKYLQVISGERFTPTDVEDETF